MIRVEVRHAAPPYFCFATLYRMIRWPPGGLHRRDFALDIFVAAAHRRHHYLFAGRLGYAVIADGLP